MLTNAVPLAIPVFSTVLAVLVLLPIRRRRKQSYDWPSRITVWAGAIALWIMYFN